MSLSDLRRLGCPACGRPHDLLVLLDHAGAAARGGPWAEVACPACGTRAELELASESAAIGRVIATGALRFEPAERVRQPGLRVVSAPDALVVELLHRRFVLPRKR